MKKLWIICIILALVMVLPFLLQRPAEEHPVAQADSPDVLVIVSAHNESIKYEFEQAFRAYYRKKTGRNIVLDWRSLGGTSEIIRYVESTFTANFRNYWVNELKLEWTERIANNFMNKWLTEDDKDWKARQLFLESNIGTGIDIFFGGGQYEFANLAAKGEFVPCGLRERHPELFEGENPLLCQGNGGETWFDTNDAYYGVCFSTFGICYNFDRLKMAGFSDEEIENFGQSWEDLADPRLFNSIGLADPSKSGSMNKCFEMLIQRKMQDVIAALPENSPLSQAEKLDLGWREAMTLVKKIGGNAAYLTFGASKVPIDTASGQIAAGMCIDYYGRSQAKWEEEHVGHPTMAFRTPTAASAVSCDPVAILRGAPNRKAAEEFVDFLFSIEAQRLWNNQAGTPGGPQKYTLHRLPVRRDLYTEAQRKYMSSPEAEPLALADSFQYEAKWTSPLFRLMQQLMRVMIIDCSPELKTAWKTIIQNGMIESLPAAFTALPFEHHQNGDVNKKLKTTEGQAEITREWLLFFLEQYRQIHK